MKTVTNNTENKNQYKFLHSIDIFIDKQYNLYFVPVKIVSDGFGKNEAYYKTLKYPYNTKQIGLTYLDLIDEADTTPYIEQKETFWGKICSKKSYNYFCLNHELISINLSRPYETTIKYIPKHSKGYGIYNGDVEISVTLSIFLPKYEKRSFYADKVGNAVNDIYYYRTRNYLVNK